MGSLGKGGVPKGLAWDGADVCVRMCTDQRGQYPWTAAVCRILNRVLYADT